MDVFCFICNIRFGEQEKKVRWADKSIHEHCLLERQRQARLAIVQDGRLERRLRVVATA